MRTTPFCAICLLLTAPLVGQTYGDISGEVVDPSGAVVPQVSITLTNTATNAVRTTESNTAGVYTFPALQPGLYVLRAEKSGFKTFTRPNIKIQVQLSARINISVAETIEVSAQAALLQRPSPAL